MQFPPTSISLRIATAEDNAFMQMVYAGTRADEMALVDWNDEQKSAFLQMQFEAQRTSYLRESPNAQYSVILSDGVPAGRLIVDRTDDTVHVIDIALLPAYRNFGIGKSVLLGLQDEAREANKAVRLHVENFNRAYQLYERLGFKKVAEAGFHWRMEWKAEAADVAQVA
ncbi:MAG TPA: GNAT family N-acetyltransferase [Pyrinomonadaceae bacterium]|nr:GNAT family N-acetyltransferase [Pyrinomonadaceae bacterium]